MLANVVHSRKQLLGLMLLRIIVTPLLASGCRADRFLTAVRLASREGQRLCLYPRDKKCDMAVLLVHGQLNAVHGMQNALILRERGQIEETLPGARLLQTPLNELTCRCWIVQRNILSKVV